MNRGWVIVESEIYFMTFETHIRNQATQLINLPSKFCLDQNEWER